MKTLKIEIQFVDGTRLEFTTTTYSCLADRVAFEHRFGIPFASVLQASQEGKAFEEHPMFLVWRAANRHADQGPFDAWVERVADFDITDTAEQNGQVEDPTVALAAP